MAATYEVNIALNAQDFKTQLKDLKKDVDSIGKVRTKTAKDTKSAEDKSWANNNKILRLENAIEASRLNQIKLAQKGGKINVDFAEYRNKANEENLEMIRGMKLEGDLLLKEEKNRLALQTQSAKIVKSTGKAKAGYNTDDERYQMALQNMAAKTSKIRRANQIERRRSLSLGKDIVRLTTKEVQLNQKNAELLAKANQVRSSNRMRIGGDYSDIASRRTYTQSGQAANYINFGRNRTAKFNRQGALSSAAISGAFPLLFGQSPLVAGAGALGGGIGGGFGGQMGGFAGGLAATAAVTAITQAVQAVSALGQAMGPFVQDTSALIRATGQSNTQRERELKLIEKYKGSSAAFEEAMKDMEKLVGKDGVEALRLFGEDMARLNADWAKFMTQMQAGFAKLLNWSGIFGGGKEGKGSLLGRAGKLEGDEELTKLLEQRAQYEKMRSQGGRRQAALSNNLVKIRERMAILDAKAIEDGKKKEESEERRLQLLKNIEDAHKRIAKSVRNDIESGIKGIIKGTASWGDMLNNVADMFLDIALKQALYGNIAGEYSKGAGIFGMFGGMFEGRADGGPVTKGSPYIVGERGPELFVPKNSGRIIPNGSAGNNIVVNVDATGSEVEGDAPNAEQLGRLIGAAVQAELLKQKRPGGLLV